MGREKKALKLGLTAAPQKKSADDESSTVDVVATRIKDALLQNPNLKPQTWMEVVKGLELILKYKGESDSDDDVLGLFEEKLKDFKK